MFHHTRPHTYVEVNGVVIDVEAIRSDLIDDAYACAAVVTPAALGDLPDLEQASAEDLVRLAFARHIDLNRYRVD